MQDEITEMKRKLKIMNHQIDQLKEEISSKESALVKEHLEHQRSTNQSVNHSNLYQSPRPVLNPIRLCSLKTWGPRMNFLFVK